MQGFSINTVSAPPNVSEGQIIPPVGEGGWGRDCAPGIAGTKVSADPLNDLLGNVLRVLELAEVRPTANRFDDLIDSLNNLYRGVSDDQRNVLLVDVDGKPLLTLDQSPGNLLRAGRDGLSVTVTAEDVEGLADVAKSGKFADLDGTPDPFILPPATTETLGGIIAGSGLAVAADGTLSAIGQVRTVNENGPDENGNVAAIVQDAKVTVPDISVSLIEFQGGTGNPLLRVLQCHGVGTHTVWNGLMLQIDTVPATEDSLGTVMAGAGLAVAADGTLSTEGTTIVNLTGAASVALDLTPIVQGAPEILFNLPVAAGITTALSITNPPEAGKLAAFVLVVNNGAGSALVWPSNIRWPQSAAPALTGVAGMLDTFVIYTQDGGASYKGFIAGQDQ
ncbi:hypothetical protein [Paraburkholderia youngii]|uniref:hypothetical protein n=1 Tax=Paraburkholderia youngii TaxID=2782701 RepID=UPI0015915D5E|nr:hypothetical protein [Paraburkholderia youngii]NUX55912.1 hypothetical protein [Paraburkholderia youngii]